MSEALPTPPVILGISTSGFVIGSPDSAAPLPSGMVPVKNGSTLSGDDLRALGLIVSNWAVAEQLMRITLAALFTHPAIAATGLPSQNINAFSRKRQTWNKVVRDTCAPWPELLDVGLFLAARGDELATTRDQAAHWPATRAVAQPDGKTHFSDMALTIAFDTQSLMALAADIQTWGQMVMCFMIVAGVVLQLPSFQGASPPAGPLWQSLVAYRQTRRPRTQPRKFLRRPSPSAAPEQGPRAD